VYDVHITNFNHSIHTVCSDMRTYKLMREMHNLLGRDNDNKIQFHQQKHPAACQLFLQRESKNASEFSQSRCPAHGRPPYNFSTAVLRQCSQLAAQHQREAAQMGSTDTQKRLWLMLVNLACLTG